MIQRKCLTFDDALCLPANGLMSKRQIGSSERDERPSCCSRPNFQPPIQICGWRVGGDSFSPSPVERRTFLGQCQLSAPVPVESPCSHGTIGASFATCARAYYFGNPPRPNVPNGIVYTLTDKSFTRNGHKILVHGDCDSDDFFTMSQNDYTPFCDSRLQTPPQEGDEGATSSTTSSSTDA